MPTYIHTYMHTYIHTYMHSYTHTYTQCRRDIRPVGGGANYAYIHTCIHTCMHVYIQDADETLDQLEEALITRDFGVKTSMRICDGLREAVKAGDVRDIK